jgi:hypothetical protein
MKKQLIIVYMTVLVFMSYSNVFAGWWNFGKEKKAINESTSQSPLDQEALDLAKAKVFSKMIVKCGNLTYVKAKSYGPDYRTYERSYGGGSYDVVSEVLSQATIMNGVQWRGSANYTLNGPTQFATASDEYGQWRDVSALLHVELTKKNGVWSIDYTPTHKPLTCDEALNPTRRW